MNGADVVAEILKREGTEFLSCYPRNPLIEACAKIDIRPILCRQERVGVGMADGYSRINMGKRIGVFAAQHGPGIENAFPGVTQAYSENVPLLVLPASGPLKRQFTRPVFSAVDNYAHVTKWAAFVGDVQDLPDHLYRAFHLMRTGKPGPVLLEIPNEVFNAEYKGDIDYEPARVWRSAPDPADVRAAAAILAEAERPVIFAGQGVLRAEATDSLIALAERLSAPVLTTNPGKSAFPENHPLALGSSVVSAPRALSEFLRDADVVFAIGSSLTITNFGPNPPAGKRIIHSTNDHEDVNKDHRVECAMIGDAKISLDQLLDALSGADIRNKGDVAASVGKVRSEWRADWQRHLASNEVPIDPYRVVNDLMETVDRENVIITHDSGSPREQLHPFWESVVPNSYMGWGKSTQLGHSLGLALGAKLARPDKLCVHVLGDAAIGMVGMDLETAARNGIAILTVVLNNGIMAAERDVLIESDEKYAAMTVGGNYKPVADALGVAGFRVDAPGDIVPVLREAIAVTESGRPALVECMTAECQEFSRY
jgi:acetolactate synthase-1/2/3 large subunit